MKSLRLFDSGNKTEIFVFETETHTFRSVAVEKENHRFCKQNRLERDFEIVEESDLSKKEIKLLNIAKKQPVYLTQNHTSVKASAELIEESRAILHFQPLKYPVWLENDADERAYSLPKAIEVTLPQKKILAATLLDWRGGQQNPTENDTITEINGSLYSGYKSTDLQLSYVVWESGAVGAGVAFYHFSIVLEERQK